MCLLSIFSCHLSRIDDIERGEREEKLTFSMRRLWKPPENPLDPGLPVISASGVLTREDQDCPGGLGDSWCADEELAEVQTHQTTS
jgi:hypothetical protein